MAARRGLQSRAGFCRPFPRGKGRAARTPLGTASRARPAPLTAAIPPAAPLEKVATVEAWASNGAVKPISAVDLFFCIWAMTQSYADFASQMALMKRKKVLETPDYEAAKATIVQLVLGGLGLPDTAASKSSTPRRAKRT
jgi:YcdC-like protein, C-terminal region